MIEIATDGSAGAPKAKGQKTPGGWAFVVTLEDGVAHLASGFEAATTISRMELTAAVKALEWVVRTFDHPPEKLTIVTDSSYVRNCFKERWYVGWRANGWRNSQDEPVANRDLWERLLQLHEAIRPKWTHVKGHQGRHDGNELADKLAVQARKEGTDARANSIAS